LNIAIIGIGGIGKVHARIFHSLGANVVAILGSTKESAERAVKQLASDYDLSAEPFWNLQDLLHLPLDGVSICTPPQLHHEHILASFDKNLAVFCEKPLFWLDESYTQMKYKLSQLNTHKNRKLFLNISNQIFITRILDRLPKPEYARMFYFQFNTHGSNKGRDILIDLLPHGLSLLQCYFGNMDISNSKFSLNSDRAIAEFYYGKCKVKFDFQQNTNIQKKFLFKVNESEYRRVQEGSGAEYKVCVLDKTNNDKFELEDPFITYISNFIEYCKNQDKGKKDNYEEAEINLALMNSLLNKHTRDAFI